MVFLAGASVEDAVTMASKTPAEALGLQGYGDIQPGMHADLTVLNERLEVQMTIVGGRVVYRA